jgi:ribonuclease BN (tRNA processing enzyme)
VAGLSVKGFCVDHPSGADAFALRLAVGGRTLAYSGDTDWRPALVAAAHGTDLTICEAYTWDRPARFHMDHHRLVQSHRELGAKRLVITHMDEAVLAHRSESPFEAAYDGLQIEI